MQTAKFKPLRDYILVKPLVRVQSSIIHVISNEVANRGQVVRVGNGKQYKRGFRPLDVKVGEIVNFMEHKGLFPEYWEDGQRYLIMQEADVCILDGFEIDGDMVH